MKIICYCKKKQNSKLNENKIDLREILDHLILILLEIFYWFHQIILAPHFTC